MHYRAYNLVIESPTPLPPLPADGTGGPPDVVIRQASVAADGLPVARSRRAFAHVGENVVWLDVKGVARFLIERGEAITFEPYAGADDDTLRLYLLGSGLGALLHQRGHLVLHANAVQVGDGAVLFAGVSGAGKSTTAAVFHQKGYRVIADDVTAVDGEGRALGGSPHLKLWEDALDQLKISKDGHPQPLRQPGRSASDPHGSVEPYGHGRGRARREARRPPCDLVRPGPQDRRPRPRLTGFPALRGGNSRRMVANKRLANSGLRRMFRLRHQHSHDERDAPKDSGPAR
ncbi:MAG: hypothetical protein EBS05_21015 [Proteobacteria bacterium]|nr:hypothetical protein [Pseudomonadota bacterium]